MARAQGGERVALEVLLERHYDRLFVICRRIAGNDADAADACQEALLSVVKGLPRFDGRSAFSTWTHRIATNACLDEMRRRNRRPRPTSTLPEPGDPSPGLAQHVVDRLTLEEALPQLPEEFRLPVILRDVAGLDYAEIAEALSIPPGTVRSRIARGRRQLSRLVGNQVPPDGRRS
ncbi:MAG: RNA polymerase sigma factor [Acidimicrobiales bacterium]